MKYHLEPPKPYDELSGEGVCKRCKSRWEMKPSDGTTNLKGVIKFVECCPNCAADTEVGKFTLTGAKHE